MAKVRRQALLTNGASLIGQLLRIALDRGVPVWTDAPLEDLIVEDGRVVGVRTVRDGTAVEVRARKGVLIAAGGFAHNREMRQTYGGDQPNEGKWSMSNPGDTGEAITTAMGLGAQTALMDEAWWLPSPRTGRFGQSTLDQARQRPRTIYVDADGRRFCNESNSYMEVGKAMYERNRTSRAVPCWLIFDERYRKRYAHVRSHPGYFPKEMLESGRLKRAGSLAELAATCGIDPDGLAETVDHFNEHARRGVDPDYGRGESAYNRNLGDPNRKVHPCLGPIDEAPYYACEVLPGDIGTCGGLLTDEHARVLGRRRRAHPRPLRHRQQHRHGDGPALPGPGASIANTMVFGYLAARHAAGWPDGDGPGRRDRPRRVHGIGQLRVRGAGRVRPRRRQHRVRDRRHRRAGGAGASGGAGSADACHHRAARRTDRRTLMTDFDQVNFFRDREVQDDPYEYFDWVRGQGPVWQEPHYGAFMITGHPEAMLVYGDPATFPDDVPASGAGRRATR